MSRRTKCMTELKRKKTVKYNKRDIYLQLRCWVATAGAHTLLEDEVPIWPRTFPILARFPAILL